MAERKILGGPPPVSKGEELFCPKCDTQLDNEFTPGYGLAFGGMGIYWSCWNETCDWFYKELD